MKCPIDNNELTIQSKEGIVGYCCDECHGIFLKGSGMKAFKLNHSTEVLEYRFSKQSNTESLLTCSCCDNQMQTSWIDDTEIDICQHCQGVWFDKHEAKSIIKGYGSNASIGFDSFGFFTGYATFEILFWILAFAFGSISMSSGCSG